jgi:nitroreductase
MDFSSLNKSLRSIRDFRQDEVSESVLKQILDDALWSHSWSNAHPCLAVLSHDLRIRII